MLAGGVQAVGLGRGDLGVGRGGVEALGGGIVDLLDQLRALERERRRAERQRGQGSDGCQSDSSHVRPPSVDWGSGGGSITQASATYTAPCSTVTG